MNGASSSFDTVRLGKRDGRGFHFLQTKWFSDIKQAPTLWVPGPPLARQEYLR